MAFNRGPGGSQSGASDIEDTPVTIAQGGTNATTAAQARTNLGIGTMGTQPSNSVSITGGTITGISPLPVASGGTGASGQAEARANLGIGSAATQATEYFATAAQGTLADSAVQPGDLATVATTGALDDLVDVVITSATTDQVLTYNGTNWVNATAGAGVGDVVGPATATDSAVVLFDGTTGKLIKDGGVLGTAAFDDTGDFATSAQGANADTAFGWGDHAAAGYLDSADIGVTVQGYDATIVVDADIGVTVQGYSSVLQNTTASFTTADETKLDGIETGADVTDATNVAAAGAVMDGDFSTNGLMKRTGAGTYSVVTDNSTNWDTAYSWGDHSVEGYLTTAVTSATAGTGMSVSSSTGAVTFTNTAPDQTVVLTAGTGISTSGTYPNFTITNSAPDQTVSLTGAGTTSISGTYPNFTITSNDSANGTVTSVAATAGTGISITGSPITSSGTLNITNTAPDQTVVLTAGTGISTSGTYPNFTITNSAPDQTVSLTGSGATSVSGTYPNFTISSTDTNTTYTAGTGLSLVGTTFSNSDRGSSQNIFKNIAVSGQSTIVADSNNDTVTVAAGTGVTLTTNATTDTLTITNSAPDQTVGITAGTGISVSGTYPNFTVAATNNGTVTSVGLSAPTGFSVAGSPVSTTGTLALSFAAGYSLPTTASQTNWNTAYGWGDHAAAGYLDAADIGVTVQGYDADTAKYDATTANFTGTLQNGGSNVVVDSDIGSTVQAYDSNLTSFVNTFTLPTTDGTNGQILTTNGTGTLSFTSPGGSGTVTSVGMTVPTGLTVSGSPITSSGTLAVTYSAGYAIPTTAKQTNWDTAYSWGNHATAGYAADSAVVKLTGDQTVAGTKTFSSTISGSITGNAGTVTNGVYTTGNQTIGGTKTFSSTIVGSITGNAGTVTNGVVTTGSYANPSWITSLSETKVLPSQTSNSGKYLTTNGTSTSWATVDALPSQTGNSGKYLTTDGTTASWANVSGGQYLGTAATKAIMYNAQSIAENITISGTYNALSAGPITIDSTYTVTVSSGAVWTIV